MGTTLRDIAEQLDVSPGLVSRVLNNKPGAWASEATQKRILETARELKYRPSAMARALVTGRAMQVAMLLPGDNNRPLIGMDLRGIIEAAAAHSYRVVVMPSVADEPNARELDDLLADRVVDGVCLPVRGLHASHLQVLAKHQTPCVLIGESGTAAERDLLGYAVHVDHDNYRYAYDSTRWLLEQGKTRIAWIRARGEQDQPHSLELRRGYRDAMAEAGLQAFVESAKTSAEIAAFTETGRFDAVIVRWLSNAMPWIRNLRDNRDAAQDMVVLAHLSESEAHFCRMSGFSERFAYHAHSDWHVGRRAGQALMQWITSGERGEDVLLVAPPAPAWCEIREK